MRRALSLAAALVLGAGAGGCSNGGLSPSAERGRQVYLAQCTACHSADSGQPGSVGPPVKGSSRALLEAKVVHGTYPPGYTPKSPTKVMVPLPALAADIDALADYLR